MLNRTYLDTEAVKIGIQKGMEQGIEKGKSEEKIKIAKNLIALGLDKVDIAKATGLKVEEIDKLRS